MKVSKFTGRWGVVCGLFLTGLLLAGCKSGAADPKFASLPGVGNASASGAAATTSDSHAASETTRTTSTPIGIASAEGESSGANNSASERDRIHVGDTLIISLSDLPGTNPSAGSQERVMEDGSINLLQNQNFKAAGKTFGQLAREIRARYVPSIFRSLTVSVQPKTETQFYFVDGEVHRPDRQVFIGRMTVLKAIASANGFSDFARKKHVVLTRPDGSKSVINCIKAQVDPKLDLEVFPGDKIFVPRRNPFW